MTERASYRRLSRRQVLVAIPLACVLPGSARAENQPLSNFFQRLTGSSSATYADRRSYGRYKGRQLVDYESTETPGTVIVDTKARSLYLVQPGGKAMAYGIGVGRTGFRWSGTAEIGRKAEWPAWHPPKEMIEREWQLKRRKLPERMEGGPDNPLGARALYLFQGEKDTLYRIHGTNQPGTIGRALSSGCIRMINEEIIELYEKVGLGTKVVVR